MSNQKDSFRIWMAGQLTRGGSKYTENAIKNCVSALNGVLRKMEICYEGNAINTIFDCDTYHKFRVLEDDIRKYPNFEELDGKGKAQRWIHNGLILYGKYLLHIENISEDMREDFYESYKTEGRKIYYYTSKYERNNTNRKRAIEIHGLTCQCCGFNFKEKYGELGSDFIEVHHVKPLSNVDQEITINPQTDLVCLCSNCHRMIHRKKNDILTVDELKGLISG